VRIVSQSGAVFVLKARLPDGQEVSAPLVPGGAVVVGRALDCPITLSGDGRASRHHAAFEMRGPQVWVRDLGSRNGTMIGGRAQVEAPLGIGEHVQVGGSKLWLEPAGGSGVIEVERIAACQRCGRAMPDHEIPQDAGSSADIVCAACQAGSGMPQIPGFQFKKLLGKGGVGSVWLAFDERLKEEVALKVLQPQSGAAPIKGALARFVREARALEALNHPNVVRLLGSGIHEAYHYLVLEYVEGSDYDELRKKRGKISAEETCTVALAVLGALEMAHGMGIVHRDVKPGNILRDNDGSVKLTDFGLARLASQTGLSVQSMSSAGMGSPLYVPPEQILAVENADARSDLYSLGASMFHMIAGRPVFDGKAVAEVVAKVLDDPPPELHIVEPSCPKGLSQAIAWALQKDPTRRYQTAAEFITGLKSALK
jgi:hypothetical protein